MNEITNTKIVSFDWAIKNLLRNKANFDILEGFLSELLRKPVKIETLLESEANQEFVDNKFNRVDVLVDIGNNEKIIIEVQTVSEWDFFHRILFGTSKLITDYTEKGQPYSTVPKVISVNILFFNLGSGKDYVYKEKTSFIGEHYGDELQLNEKSIDLYCNQLKRNYTTPSDIYPTYYIIQLKKFADIIKNKFDQWVYLLKHESIQAGFNAQGINSAKEKLDVLKLSIEERKRYDKYWQDVSFEASLVETQKVESEQATRLGKQEGIEIGKQEGIEIGKQEGIEIGKQEGKEEGKQESQLEIAKNLIKLGMDTLIIIKATNLTLEQINELKNSIDVK